MNTPEDVDLAALVAQLDAATLPEGKLVSAEDEPGPHLWVSASPVDVEQLGTIWSEHPAQLQPLLLTGLDGTADRPWLTGELFRAGVSDPDRLDVREVLQGLHADLVETYEATNPDLEPFGTAVPELSLPKAQDRAQMSAAADRVRQDLSFLGGWHLGLIPVSRPADVLAYVGWAGATNYTGDVGIISTMLRSWEERFGAQLVAADFATIYVVVAFPPEDEAAALSLAAEHIAFCPDNLFQGGVKNLREYAHELVGARTWAFWWD